MDEEEVKDAKEELKDLEKELKDLRKTAKEQGFDFPDTAKFEESLAKAKAAIEEKDADKFEKYREKAEERKDEIDEKLQSIIATQAYSAGMAQAGKMQAEALAADPSMIEPFEGVSVEDWARAAVLHTKGMDEQTLNSELAKMGMDRAKYDRVQNHFTMKMQSDTTGAISKIYGDAFVEAQPQKEAFNLERYAEIMAAQAAWAASGEDVNGKLKEVFDLSAADFGKLSGDFSQALMKDATIMNKLTTLQEKYQLKYASADTDADLDL